MYFKIFHYSIYILKRKLNFSYTKCISFEKRNVNSSCVSAINQFFEYRIKCLHLHKKRIHVNILLQHLLN